MKPDSRFSHLGMRSWAYVKAISQGLGYVHRGGRKGKSVIKVPTRQEMSIFLEACGLSSVPLDRKGESATRLGDLLSEYFHLRAQLLEDKVRDLLMEKEEAKRLFNDLRAELKPDCPIPNNKQKGDKRGPALFTGIVNMLIEAKLKELLRDG